MCSPTIRPAPAPAPAPARTIDSPAGRRRRGAPPASGVRRVPDPSFTAAAGNTGNKTTTTPAAATVSPCIAGVRPANTRARTYQTGPPPDTTHMQYRRRNDTSVHTVRLLRVHHHRHLDWTRRGRSGQRCESTAPPDTIIRRTVRYRATKSRRPITGDWDSLRPAAVSAAATTYQPGNQLLATGPKALLNHHHQND